MNVAYIDGNNLHMGTAKDKTDPWEIDMQRFRILLKQKYRVEEAYYFMGVLDPRHQDIYTALQRSGFILVFREHGIELKGKKKGNIDVDLTFQVMRDLRDRENLEKIVIVSGDGDYYRMVDYLIKENRFEKLLLPNKRFASSLYKRITRKYFAHLDNPDMRVKIGKK